MAEEQKVLATTEEHLKGRDLYDKVEAMHKESGKPYAKICEELGVAATTFTSAKAYWEKKKKEKKQKKAAANEHNVVALAGKAKTNSPDEATVLLPNGLKVTGNPKQITNLMQKLFPNK